MTDDHASRLARDLARIRYLERCVFPLIGEDEAQAFSQGSASLFRHGGHCYLVTAAHVAEDIVKNPDGYGIPLIEGADAGQIWTLGRGRVSATPSQAEDIAVFRFFDSTVIERLQAGGRIFLSSENVAASPSKDLLIVGWPAVAVTYSGGKVDAQSLILQLARIEGGDRPTDVYLEWPAARSEPLQGISGAPIWAISQVEADGIWHPSREVTLVGVEHTVRKGSWVRGTAWSVVMRLIAELEGDPGGS